jgi:hypothetical protein
MAVRGLGLLDAPAQEAFDRFTRLATALLGVPISLLTLVDSDLGDAARDAAVALRL